MPAGLLKSARRGAKKMECPCVKASAFRARAALAAAASSCKTARGMAPPSNLASRGRARLRAVAPPAMASGRPVLLDKSSALISPDWGCGSTLAVCGGAARAIPALPGGLALEWEVGNGRPLPPLISTRDGRPAPASPLSPGEKRGWTDKGAKAKAAGSFIRPLLALAPGTSAASGRGEPKPPSRRPGRVGDNAGESRLRPVPSARRLDPTALKVGEKGVAACLESKATRPTPAPWERAG